MQEEGSYTIAICDSSEVAYAAFRGVLRNTHKRPHADDRGYALEG